MSICILIVEFSRDLSCESLCPGVLRFLFLRLNVYSFFSIVLLIIDDIPFKSIHISVPYTYVGSFCFEFYEIRTIQVFPGHFVPLPFPKSALSGTQAKLGHFPYYLNLHGSTGLTVGDLPEGHIPRNQVPNSDNTHPVRVRTPFQCRLCWMVTLESLKFVLALARLYIEPPLGKGMPTLGDRGGPSLSRFLHTVSSAVSKVGVNSSLPHGFSGLSGVIHPRTRLA